MSESHDEDDHCLCVGERAVYKFNGVYLCCNCGLPDEPAT